MRTPVLLLFILIFGFASPAGKKCPPVPIREHSVLAILWQQRSAEYRALCFQAYNMARLQLDLGLIENMDSKKPPAIITDIDETVLDNSPFDARLVFEDKEFDRTSWKEWGELRKAGSIPGALDFFKYAESRGVEIFYISNRTVDQQEETMANLDSLGFPFIDNRHFLLKDQTSRKQARRDEVLKDYDVILYLGDNLGDFAPQFDDTDRHDHVDSMRSGFGFKYIVLPNPMYGDWETKELYQGKYDWTDQQKDSIRRANLIIY